MIEAAYDRIAAAIRHGRGSRLIAVLVPPEIPLIPATEKLRSHLLGRGIAVRPIRVDRYASLIEAIEAVDPCLVEVVVVYGLEALSQTARESFLRASSFTRTRLQAVPVAVILVLGTETWSWLGMELPDLARWADGPFLVSDGGKGIELRPLRPRLGRKPLADSTVVLDDYRNVDIQGPINEWIARGGILSIGGPNGVGATHLAVRIEAQLAELGRRTASTENVLFVNGVPMIGGPESVGDPDVPWPQTLRRPLSLEDWIEQHRNETVFIAKAFWHPDRASALERHGITGVVLGPSSSALTRPHVGAQLYIPPVQVVEDDGSEHVRGIERMVAAILTDARHQLQIDLETLLPRELLSTLAYASGGLPGVLWSLVIQTLQRALRVGSTIATPGLVESIIVDIAGSRPTVPEEAVASAVGANVLDFALEARGAVLFYVIDEKLCVVRHPLSILAARFRAAAESAALAPTKPPRRRRRSPRRRQ